MLRDYLKLQSIIFLWGFTAVLGALISLPSLDLVVWRTLIATIALLFILGGKVVIERRMALQFLGTGAIIGVHWICFFGAVKVSNVSVCMVGLATLALWTALLEPLMVPNRKLRLIDLLFGLIVTAGVYMIFRSDFAFGRGLLIAIASAIAGAVFSIINGFHVQKAHHHVITCYEMAGACLFTIFCLPFAKTDRLLEIPGIKDTGYLLLLALACTVYPFSAYVELLKRLSVFTINFTNNLEPVYGITLAALILKDYKHLSTGFYFGALVILLSVIAYPLVRMAWVRR